MPYTKIDITKLTHIKYVHIYINNGHKNTKTFYTIALLTDNNNCIFERWYANENCSTEQFIYNFWRKFLLKYYFDEKTELTYIYNDKNVKYNKSILMLLQIVSRYVDMNITNIDYKNVINQTNSILHVFKKGSFDKNKLKKSNNNSDAISKKLFKIYDFLLENHVCPFISNEINIELELNSIYNKNIKKKCLVSLYYMFCRTYRRNYKNKYKQIS